MLANEKLYEMKVPNNIVLNPKDGGKKSKKKQRSSIKKEETWYYYSFSVEKCKKI